VPNGAARCWALPQVNVEWWTNSNDECGRVCDVQRSFIKDFKSTAKQLQIKVRAGEGGTSVARAQRGRSLPRASHCVPA
jgi:hypothetical protein